MENDINISTTTQKIIIKLTKNEISKEIKDFSVKKQSIVDVNKDIEAIRNILDAKSGNDLIIILPSSSTGNIIGNRINKNAILKKLRILIDPSNTNGKTNHESLRGTSIQISMNVDAPISTTPQNIVVSINKNDGTTLRTNKTFQVKRESTPDEDIAAIKKILTAKINNDDNSALIILPRSSSGSIINNLVNKNAIERKIKTLIDPSNVDGNSNHPSLRGVTITLTRLATGSDFISTIEKPIVIAISKTGGNPLELYGFLVKKS